MSSPKIKVNHYNVNPHEAHIALRQDPDPDLFLVIQRTCPASLYRRDANGYRYDYAGCLECGACYILGGDAVFAKWSYPVGPYGVDYED